MKRRIHPDGKDKKQGEWRLSLFVWRKEVNRHFSF